jgi:DNA-binding beta-propeller fold protein YncE
MTTHRNRFLLTLVAAALSARAQSPLPLPNPYRIDETFKLEMPPGLQTLGSVSGLKVGPDNNLYVYHRCVENTCTGHNDVPPILVYNQQGKLLRTLGAGMIVWPHGIALMPDRSIWVTDAVAGNGVDKNNPGKGHQVLHLDPNARVLLAIGKPGVAGADHDTFNAPTDVAIGRNGDIFVTDGHGAGTNARLVKFDKSGKYVKEWGTRGSAPGQFDAPHAIAIDPQGRVLVADRPNSRIEIFDQDGEFLAQWKQFGRPSGLAIDKNGTLYVTDTQSTKDRPGFENGIYIGSVKDGKVTGFIPKIRPHSTWEGEGPDRTNMEAIGVAPDGSAIYGGETGLHTVVKFVKNK